MASISGFRDYGVIGDESDAELQLCLDAAAAYAKGAGVSEPDGAIQSGSNALYDLLIYRLATFYRDNRGFPEQSNDALYLGCNGLILQLRDE